MEAAWKEHVGKLTLEQLSSAEACREHLEGFHRQLVADGVRGTAIGSVQDVQHVIAEYLQNTTPATPAALRELTRRSRNFYVTQLVNELIEIAKEAASLGLNHTRPPFQFGEIKPKDENWIYVYKCESWRDFMDTHLHDQQSYWNDIINRLKELGFTIDVYPPWRLMLKWDL